MLFYYKINLNVKIILAVPFKTEVEKLYIMIMTLLSKNYTFRKFKCSDILVTLILFT